MNRTKEDLIQYRLQKANETFDRAKFSISKKYWNAAASELYYTCFYLVLALFAKNDLNASTHKAVNSLFALHFIKEGKAEVKWGRLVKVLFDKRQKGDYGDFMFLTEEEVVPLVSEVEDFFVIINKLLQD